MHWIIIYKLVYYYCYIHMQGYCYMHYRLLLYALSFYYMALSFYYMHYAIITCIKLLLHALNYYYIHIMG